MLAAGDAEQVVLDSRQGNDEPDETSMFHLLK
jgi:hypothetical protein